MAKKLQRPTADPLRTPRQRAWMQIMIGVWGLLIYPPVEYYVLHRGILIAAVCSVSFLITLLFGIGRLFKRETRQDYSTAAVAELLPVTPPEP